MRKSARLAEARAKLKNEVHMEPKTKKIRPDNRISKIAALDNGTMVEAFKYLSYCQLATRSLVSTRFRNVIQTHRYQLALLYVDEILMERNSNRGDFPTCIFDEELSTEAYNEWVIRNQYSKQIPLKCQIAEKQNTQRVPKLRLWADANYKDSNNSYIQMGVLCAKMELNHENWPLFQHFVRLLTDSFIYIRSLELYLSQQGVVNLLTESFNKNRNRLQCEKLSLVLQDDIQNSLSSIKDHVHCNKFQIRSNCDSNYDAEFLDFFMTGANCTSKVEVKCYELSQVVINFVQKFMDLKNCDEYQVVVSIRGYITNGAVLKLLKRDYAGVIVKETRTRYYNYTTFEFTNNNINKKLTCVLGYSISH